MMLSVKEILIITNVLTPTKYLLVVEEVDGGMHPKQFRRE